MIFEILQFTLSSNYSSFVLLLAPPPPPWYIPSHHGDLSKLHLLLSLLSHYAWNLVTLLVLVLTRSDIISNTWSLVVDETPKWTFLDLQKGIMSISLSNSNTKPPNKNFGSHLIIGVLVHFSAISSTFLKKYNTVVLSICCQQHMWSHCQY